MSVERPRPETTYRFRFDSRYRVLALPFGVTPDRSWVSLDDDLLAVRFGPWRVETDVGNLAGAEITGPYTLAKTAGPAHLSFSDRGLTFATNAERGVCIRFHEPVRGIDPTGAIRHPGLTVTVEDVERVREAVDLRS